MATCHMCGRPNILKGKDGRKKCKRCGYLPMGKHYNRDGKIDKNFNFNKGVFMTNIKVGEGIRQGDVYFFRVGDGELPSADKCKPVKGQHVLAYGEASGHQHSFPQDDCELYSANDNLCKLAKKYGVKEDMAVTYGLRIVVDNTKILHGTPSRMFSDPDHTPIEVYKGDYIVLRPREYSDEEEFKVIAD